MAWRFLRRSDPNDALVPEIVWWILGGLTLVGIVCGLVWTGVLRLDGYCYLYPGIDTRYATGYSERVFTELRPGMTTEEVRGRLGEPLDAFTNRYGNVIWSYTLDGKCQWADYAWLMRRVAFRDGRVYEITKRVSHD